MATVALRMALYNAFILRLICLRNIVPGYGCQKTPHGTFDSGVFHKAVGYIDKGYVHAAIRPVHFIEGGMTVETVCLAYASPHLNPVDGMAQTLLGTLIRNATGESELRRGLERATSRSG